MAKNVKRGKMKVPAEVYFLRYAFPCSHIICKIRKEISDEEYKKMERAAAEGKVLGREYLEKVFFRAFERIEKIAKEMKKDKWDKEVIEEYFVRRHNFFVDASDNPESFKELCRIHRANVSDVKGKELIVEYENGKKRTVKNNYVPNVKVGDKVMIHYFYAVEKV